MTLIHVDATQLEPVLLAAIWRHDGELGIRQLDRVLVGRLFEPSNLGEALRHMVAKGLIVGIRDDPNTYPRYKLTEIGRQAAEQSSEMPPKHG